MTWRKIYCLRRRFMREELHISVNTACDFNRERVKGLWKQTPDGCGALELRRMERWMLKNYVWDV